MTNKERDQYVKLYDSGVSFQTLIRLIIEKHGGLSKSQKLNDASDDIYRLFMNCWNTEREQKHENT